jgi:transcriptional regulator with XRE-family HTH domain
MNFEERFQRLMKSLQLNERQLAEIFGVDDITMSRWCQGRVVPQFEFRATLLRLESDNMASISPHLSAETLAAFKRGRAQ